MQCTSVDGLPPAPTLAKRIYCLHIVPSYGPGRNRRWGVTTDRASFRRAPEVAGPGGGGGRAAEWQPPAGVGRGSGGGGCGCDGSLGAGAGRDAAGVDDHVVALEVVLHLRER